jgi:hypothetical protein
VARFTEALDDPDGGREAAQAVRSLIGGIVLTPGKKRGEVHADLRGELMGRRMTMLPHLDWIGVFPAAFARHPD